jgi:hypothetical protein
LVNLSASSDLTLSTSLEAAPRQFVAELADVHPDGSAWNVSDGIAESTENPATIDFGVIGHEFGRGHRVRVSVSGAAWPRYVVLPGTRIIHTGPSHLAMAEVS